MQHLILSITELLKEETSSLFTWKASNKFLIDYKLKVDGQDYEVTPFINSIYHSNETLAFSNFFHQVKSGKTSDAETLMERLSLD